jgi:hypothetical protein
MLGCTPADGWHIDSGATIPPGAIPAPSGSYVREAFSRQYAKAEADDFTIYLHEWYKGGEQPGPYGWYHIQQIVRRLPKVPFPVVIQPAPSLEKLNESRRRFVVTSLLNAGITDAEQRVILGFPEAGGLYGDEIEPIYERMLTRPQNQGFGFGGGLVPGFSQPGFGTGFGTFGGGFGGFGGGFGGGFFR